MPEPLHVFLVGRLTSVLIAAEWGGQNVEDAEEKYLQKYKFDEVDEIIDLDPGYHLIVVK